MKLTRRLEYPNQLFLEASKTPGSSEASSSEANANWLYLGTMPCSQEQEQILSQDGIEVRFAWDYLPGAIHIFWRYKLPRTKSKEALTTTGESKSLGNSLGSPDASKDADNGGNAGEAPSEDCRYKDRRWWAG